MRRGFGLGEGEVPWPQDITKLLALMADRDPTSHHRDPTSGKHKTKETDGIAPITMIHLGAHGISLRPLADHRRATTDVTSFAPEDICSYSPYCRVGCTDGCRYSGT
jgi:hypothetical protein